MSHLQAFFPIYKLFFPIYKLSPPPPPPPPVLWSLILFQLCKTIHTDTRTKRVDHRTSEIMNFVQGCT